MNKLMITTAAAVLLMTTPVMADPPEVCTGNCETDGGDGGGGVTNTNTNRNNNTNSNRQGQLQGQVQSSRSSSESNARGGNARSNAEGGKGIGVAGARAGDNSIVIEGDNIPKAPVNSAYAPALVASDGTCMGSTSAGGQSSTFGLSFGTTWADSDCNRRRDAAFFFGIGMPDIAVRIMMEAPTVKAAMKAQKDREAGVVAEPEGQSVEYVEEEFSE